MPRPGDWNAIGLEADPTPGEPETITQLADIFQNLGTKAREIYNAIEQVMNSADDSVFSGATAEALRGKVDQRLRGHVEDVAWAFETSAGALRDWHGVVIEQQSKADTALNAGRGLAEDDPERQRQADLAKQAGEYQAEQGRSVSERIRNVSHIALPISACEAFWEAFKWLGIILIIPALLFGGPIALLALGVNLTMFIKVAVDVANGDAKWLDLFLAGLGLIAPTTKALPIFSIFKAAGSLVSKGWTALSQGVKTLFTREFLVGRLIPGLIGLGPRAWLAFRETGLLVVTGIKNIFAFGAGIIRATTSFSLAGLLRMPGALGAWAGRTWQGAKASWVAGREARKAWWAAKWEATKFHFGGTKLLRFLLPVDAAEIRVFGFAKALKIGFVERGLLFQHRFGAAMPLAGGIGHAIGAAPINAGGGLGDGLNLARMTAPPPVELAGLRIGGDLGSVTNAGFHAAKQLDSLDGIRIDDLVNVRTGDLGFSVAGPTTVTSSGLHIPATAGTSLPSTTIAANLAGAPGPTPLPGAVLPASTHVPVAVLPASTHAPGAMLGAAHVPGAALPGSAHLPGSLVSGSVDLPGTNLLGAGVNAVPGNGVTSLAAAHLPPPAAASIGDLIAPAVRNATPPTMSPGLGTRIGEGTTHGLIANQVRLGLDDLVNVPNTHLQNTPVIQAPTVDRIGAAMQLVDHKPSGLHSATPPPGGLNTSHAVTPGTSGHAVPPPAGGHAVPPPGDGLRPPALNGFQADDAARAGSAKGTPLHTVPNQPVSVPVKPVDLSVQQPLPGHSFGVPNENLPGTAGRGPGDGPPPPGRVPPNRTDVPLTGLPDRPGAFIRIEEHGGRMATYQLFDGGPHGRMDVLPGNHMRFTDDVTGQTFRFDKSGAMMDKGVRLTQGDGVLRPDDRIVVQRPDGSHQLTTLAGDGVPEQLTVRSLEGGGAQVVARDGVSWNYGQNGRLQGQSVGASWDSDLAARAGVFRRPGETDDVVASRIDDFTDVQRAQKDFDAAKTDAVNLGHRTDGTSRGPSVGDQANQNLHGAQQNLDAAKRGFEAEHGLQVDGLMRQLDDLLETSIKDRPRLVGAGVDAVAPIDVPGLGNVQVRVGNGGTRELLNANPGTTLDDLADGGFQVTEGSRSFRYTAAGQLLDERITLGGSTGQFVIRYPDGSMRLDGSQNVGVRGLDDGSFRVFDNDGQAQRYAADGSRRGDARSLVGDDHRRGSLFVETDPLQGARLVDLRGHPVPVTRFDDLGNGRYLASTDGAEFRWYSANGNVERTGIRIADPAHQGEVFVASGNRGQLSLVDHAGTDLHSAVIRADGGFRIAEADGVARTFDKTGAYLDRQVRLPPPAAGGEQRLLVHTADNALSVHGPTGTRLNDTVDLLPDGGYRVTSGSTYQVHDALGVHRASGYPVALRGQDGFLEIAAGGGAARQLDDAYQPVPDRTVEVNPTTREITVTQGPGGRDVFGPDGSLLREVTDIRANTFDHLGTQVIRNHQDGSVRWIAADGTELTSASRLMTRFDDGRVRLQIELPGGPRHGEYHVFSRAGELTEQGIPVVRNGVRTNFTYVVDHAAGTWQRTVDNTGAFHHGKADVSAASGRIRLLSSTGNAVEVFERRWLPDHTILDSFRKTDTLGYGHFDRTATWVSYGEDGASTGWGLRRFDTTGSGWQDFKDFSAIREYRDGLQKFGNQPGHVLAIRNGDHSWSWYKHDSQGNLIVDGVRVREKLGDGWTDTLVRANGDVEIAQKKWGMWHGTENAGQYKEFTLTPGADNLVNRPGTWDQVARQGRPTGNTEAVPGGGLREVVRQGEQRPPAWVRESPILGNHRPTDIASHIAEDSRYQLYKWSQDGNSGIRYVATDASTVDVDLNGNFVRSTGKLSDGSVLKVGHQHARPEGAPPSAGAIPWENGTNKGWRVADAEGWRDFDLNNNPVRRGLLDGSVKEFTDLSNSDEVWVLRDAHGNLTGSSTRSMLDGEGNLTVANTSRDLQRFVVGDGPFDSSKWRWYEVDGNGLRVEGTGGKRQFFRGSTDEALSWDDSFRDFDATGNLVRDRRMMDAGRYIESWKTADDQWHSAVFRKTGARVPGSETTRLWSTGGEFQTAWTKGADYFADVRPAAADGVQQTVRETPTHVRNSPVRVREYIEGADGLVDHRQWKEFDHGAVVRDRTLSGTNYLETEKWRGQWKLYDEHGNVLGERGHDGKVFELRDGKLTLTGSEYDFGGPLTELRGQGRKLREAQRMPWLRHDDFTFGSGSTVFPHGNPALREAVVAPYMKSVFQKAMVEFGQDFVLEFTANLIVNAIIAEAQGRSFNGNDALRALMNAGVSSTIKTGVGTALNDTNLGGALRTFRQGEVNMDVGKHWNRRPLNNDRLWTNEWAGNEAAQRWRGGVYDFGFAFGPSLLSGFVNGTMNAAIFGVTNADGTRVKLTGWDAVGDGGINALASLTTGVSTGLVKALGNGVGGSRFFHRAGFGEFWLQIPFRTFEKTIQGLFLTSAYRASINPSWYQSPPPPAGQSLLVLPPTIEIAPPVQHASGLVLPAGTGGKS